MHLFSTVQICEAMQFIYFYSAELQKGCSSFIFYSAELQRNAEHLFSTVQSCKEMQLIYFYSAELHKGCSSFISTVQSCKGGSGGDRILHKDRIVPPDRKQD